MTKRRTPDDPLEHLARIADELGIARIATDVRELAVRVADGRFYVACVGQFKRGKSTLLNALVDDRVLPTGIVPITTVPTVLRYGERRTARVRTRDGTWCDVDPDALAKYVSEEHNPENEKGVDAVEVFLPCPLLASGMCLVDTPGLGSVFSANSAATEAFIPHIDAALVVIGTEPPLAGEELTLVETIARDVPDVIVVLNKADRASAAERAAATVFAQRVLERRLGRPIGRLHEISALERQTGGAETRDWPLLLAALGNLVEHSEAALLRAAQRRGVKRSANQLLSALDAERRALESPMLESERRMHALERTIAEAERALDDLSLRLASEQRRLSRALAEDHDRFLRETIPAAYDEIERLFGTLHNRWGPALRREAMDTAQDIATRYVMPWLGAEQASAEEAYRRASARFVEMANEFLDRVATSGDGTLVQLPGTLDPERGLRTRSRFYFHDLLRIAHPASPLRYALDAALGVGGGRTYILRDAEAFLGRLIALNAARVESDLEERLSESRRQLEADIRALLRDVRTAAAHALERARQAHEAGAPAVEAALARVACLEDEVQAAARRTE